jgi:hypothetical protein
LGRGVPRADIGKLKPVVKPDHEGRVDQNLGPTLCRDRCELDMFELAGDKNILHGRLVEAAADGEALHQGAVLCRAVDKNIVDTSEGLRGMPAELAELGCALFICRFCLAAALHPVVSRLTRALTLD